jgi:hypothetical protein
MWKKIAIATGALVLVAALGVVFYIGPSNIIGMIRYDIRAEGAYKVGDQAPDVELVTLDGASVALASRIGAKPLVLIFGSFT